MDHAIYSIELSYEPLARGHRVLPVGFDGANYNQIAVDSQGNVQVDVVSGGGGFSGQQYTEGDVDTTITGTAILWEDTSDTLRAVSAAKPLPVTVISGGGAGTQYTEGDTDATITGTAILWEDTSDTLRAVSAAKPLPVTIISGGGAGSQFDDGDAIDTDSQGNLILGATAISGTARVLRVENDGALHIHDGGNSITVDGTVSATQGTSPWVVSGTVTETRPGTATLTNVNDTNVSTTLLAANASRLGAMIFNDSTENLFVKFGTTASSTSFTVLMGPGDYFEVPDPAYTGRIDGIWANDASGAARITELTA